MLDKEEYVRWMESAKRTLKSAKGDLERDDYKIRRLLNISYRLPQSENNT